MSDMNLDIIQNKLDALVEKIIQKEASDEDFRITYAQILERINTKIELFSDKENLDKLGELSLEIKGIIQQRQDIVDGRFAAIKSEFDRINSVLVSSFKTDDIIVTYDKLNAQMLKLGEQQDIQRAKFSKIIDFLENFNLLDETNESLRSNFAIIKEQNVIINEGVTKQLETLKNYNTQLEEANSKTMKELETILFTLQEFEDSINDDVENIKGCISEKTDSVIDKIHETDTFIDLLNTNLSTMIQVIGNIFDDEEFTDLQSDVADILTKTAFMSETLKKIAEKSDVVEMKQLLNSLEQHLVTQLDSNSQSINAAKEQILKEIKESISTESATAAKQLEKIDSGIEELNENVEHVADCVNIAKHTICEEFKSAISAESNMSNDRMAKITTSVKEICTKIETTKDELSNAILAESNTSNGRMEKLSTSIEEIGAKLQEVNADIVDTISAEGVAAAEQIQNAVNSLNELKTAIDNVKSELSDVVLNQQYEKIDNALAENQTKFVTQLIQIADNISFEDEAYELNNAIQDSTDEIKEEISCIKEGNESLNNDLKSIASGLKALTSGSKDNKDCIYSLPDIESDISKIRLDLNKIQNSILQSDSENIEAGADISSKINSIKESLQKLQNSTLDEDISEVKSLFSSLNEDVSSISKRTNKLILASDEVNKTLNNNIDGFSDLMKTFEKQSRDFYKSTFLNELNQKVSKIAQTSASISQSNQILNEAFMYLAEWVDSASETFEEITDDVTTIKNSLQASPDSEIDKISRGLKSLSIRVEEQDSKIDDLESKIDAIDDKINKILSVQGDSKEMRSLMEYIASQISIANEKMIENEKLALKMTSMDKQLKKIEKNISIITEYIDDDDAGFDVEE